ncbi:hypothetical protein BYT27DRAFT_7207078 [Phlegmacium glaucopus]|nr:hypothetical protein BYT27DRAFT_7207078 [Phlegmacium glaucopus]
MGVELGPGEAIAAVGAKAVPWGVPASNDSAWNSTVGISTMWDLVGGLGRWVVEKGGRRWDKEVIGLGQAGLVEPFAGGADLLGITDLEVQICTFFRKFPN